ncbi:transcription termination/antitermination NusG family protein [Burkholderia multivorans]|uniref:transcription termination/antitermination NusG family protein n=1 Tax=Burkholderia multivorans TaxID=87883 RepID=UPI00338D6928
MEKRCNVRFRSASNGPACRINSVRSWSDREVSKSKAAQGCMTDVVFPGYVLVEMEMTDETWHLVKNTAKVTGFCRRCTQPPPRFPRRKSRRSCRRCRKAWRSRPKTLFEVGEMVRVKEGPFTDFKRHRRRSQLRKSRVRVGHIFGRLPRSNSIRPGRKSLIRFGGQPGATFALTARVMVVEERQ